MRHVLVVSALLLTAVADAAPAPTASREVSHAH